METNERMDYTMEIDNRDGYGAVAVAIISLGGNIASFCDVFRERYRNSVYKFAAINAHGFLMGALKTLEWCCAEYTGLNNDQYAKVVDVMDAILDSYMSVETDEDRAHWFADVLRRAQRLQHDLVLLEGDDPEDDQDPEEGGTDA